MRIFFAILLSFYGIPIIAGWIINILILKKYRWHPPYIVAALLSIGLALITSVFFLLSGIGGNFDPWEFMPIALTLIGIATLFSIVLGIITSWFSTPNKQSLLVRMGFYALLTTLPTILFIVITSTVVALLQTN